jgi:hypothetical protein
MLTDPDHFIWPSEFACTIITENLLLPNYYNIKISLEPIDSNTNNINLGFKKIKYFIGNYLQNSIIVNQDLAIVKPLLTLESNLVLLPVEPYDVFFASILFQKLYTITEKYFTINYLTLDSLIGDRVQYTVNHDTDIGVDLSGNFWWNMDSINTGTDDHTSWKDLNFTDTPKFSPTVVQGGLSAE